MIARYIRLKVIGTENKFVHVAEDTENWFWVDGDNMFRKFFSLIDIEETFKTQFDIVDIKVYVDRVLN